MQKNKHFKKLYQASQSNASQLIIGLMSGTSLDGLDVALVEFTGQKGLRLLEFSSYEYSAALKQKISNSALEPPLIVSGLNFELGLLYANLINDFIAQTKLKPEDILAIASHGQTISHAHQKSTYQIGEADSIAKGTGLPVIFDFRSGDVAVKGSGAPLVPYLEVYLTRGRKGNYAFQNLGGIGNVTFITQRGKNFPEVTAFDTGPANIMTNSFASLRGKTHDFIDQDAKLAQKGRVEPRLLKAMLEHPFLKLKPPKSTGHEDFGIGYCKKLQAAFPHLGVPDLIRTSLKFSALSIKQSYDNYAPQELDKIIISGGGIYNPVLIGDLKEALAPHRLSLFSKEFNIKDDAKEAVCFALLGWQRINGVATNLAAVTGGKKAVSLGKIALPD